jgi:hopanoid biosynthesis associated RND transporter like protein HpnN
MKHVWAERWLGLLAARIYAHPNAFIYPQILLFGLCIFYTVSQLEFNTNRSDLVGAEKRYHRNFLDYKKTFQNQDELVTIVESEDVERNREFIERLGIRLNQEPDLFRDVFFKGNFKTLGPKSLQLIKQIDDVKALDEKLKSALPLLNQFTQVTNLTEMVRTINRQFRQSGKQASPEKNTEGTHPLATSLPLLTSLLDQARGSLHQEEPLIPPAVSGLLGTSHANAAKEYIQFDEGRLFLITAQPVSDELEKTAVRRLRVLVKETQTMVPGVNVGVTGKSVLELDEMQQSRKDTTKATLISLLLVVLIFIFGYRETGRPIKATLCLLISLGYTMGFTTLVVGHLNILTIAFVPMLIGLAIDFGVHLITRYEEELGYGNDNELSLKNALTYTGIGIFTGCFTTAGAFLAMGITEFKGIREMGIITGGGMILSLIPMMTMLPAMLLKGKQNVLDHTLSKASDDKRERLERLWLDRPKLVIGFALGLCIAAASQISKVYFDYNLLNLQTHGLEAVNYEHKLIHSGEKSILFGAIIANSLEEASEIETKVIQLPSVASVDSMAGYIASNNQEKLALIESIRSTADSIQLPTPNEASLDIRTFHQSLTFLASYAKLAIQSIESSGKGESFSPELSSLHEAILKLQKDIQTLDRNFVQTRLTQFQSNLFHELNGMVGSIANQDTRAAININELPDILKNRFIGSDGRLLIQVYPKSNVWERAHQEVFLKDLRTLDPENDNAPVITGTPVQLYEYTELLKLSYQEAALYALAAIMVLVWIHFRSVLTVILAMLPVFIGTLWLLGLMGLLGIPFNPANIMTLPLVIGIGVTNGIHILNRYHEEAHPSIFAKSTGKAVLVSALTTMAGFGSLMLAHHQGIASLGYVMSIGVATCMIAGLGVLPCLLKVVKPTFHKKTQQQHGNTVTGQRGTEA